LSTINAADWTHHNPSVVSNDSYDVYVSQALEHDTLFATEKMPGCVGESARISSSSNFPFSRTLSSEHVLHPQSDAVFKTPGTPASVARSPHTTSPRSPWPQASRGSFSTTPRTIVQTTTSPVSVSSPQSLRRYGQTKTPAPTTFIHSPFFYHSSGLYAPPLESSCLFPLYCISFRFSFVIG